MLPWPMVTASDSFPLLKMISKVFYFISTLRCDLLTGHGHVLALLARLCLKLRAAEELPEDDNYCLHIYFRKEIFLCISRQRKGVEVFMVLRTKFTEEKAFLSDVFFLLLQC